MRAPDRVRLPFPPSHHHKNSDRKRTFALAVRSALGGYAKPAGARFEFILDLYGPWLRPDGTEDPKMIDCKNGLYEVEDLVASALKYNDRSNWRAVITKRQCSESYCEVTLREYRG